MYCVWLNVGVVTALHVYMMLRIVLIILNRRRVYGPVFDLFEHVHTYFFFSDEGVESSISGRSETNLNLTANARRRRVTLGKKTDEAIRAASAPSAMILRPSTGDEEEWT